MDIQNKNDALVRRMQAMLERVSMIKGQDLYFYNQPVSELIGGARVMVNGREMGMYASYSYLGLVGHPRINKAAQDAVEKWYKAQVELFENINKLAMDLEGPVTTAAREYRNEIQLATKALEAGMISGMKYTEMLSAIQRKFNEVKAEAADLTKKLEQYFGIEVKKITKPTRPILRS